MQKKEFQNGNYFRGKVVSLAFAFLKLPVENVYIFGAIHHHLYRLRLIFI